MKEGTTAICWSGTRAERGFSNCDRILSWSYSATILTSRDRNKNDDDCAREGRRALLVPSRSSSYRIPAGGHRNGRLRPRGEQPCGVCLGKGVFASTAGRLTITRTAFSRLQSGHRVHAATRGAPSPDKAGGTPIKAEPVAGSRAGQPASAEEAWRCKL